MAKILKLENITVQSSDLKRALLRAKDIFMQLIVQTWFGAEVVVLAFMYVFWGFLYILAFLLLIVGFM